MNIYNNIFPIDKDVAERIFSTNDVEKISHAMVAIAFYEKDWKWAQNRCLDFLMNENPIISGLAATCLGHIARIHRQLEKDKVMLILRSRLKDTNISGRIEDALNDIEIFVK